MGLFAKIFGTDNDRQIKKIEVIAQKVEALQDVYAAMTDKELCNCTNVFKKRLSDGENLDKILPDAYACVREASTRILGMRHFHVQIIGGIALHQGRIAEMCTGEGKTLVATLPAYLNALTGRGVHIVTVNDYLAKRDAEWMGQIYRFLGLTVGVITNQQPFDEKKQAYNCDITYGTNSAFGFDYLRDNQVRFPSQMVQRELNFVIIDEVDSVLIDEARTPLIISGKNKKSSEGFYQANSFAKTLKAPNPDSENENEQMGDFEINEEDKKIVLTENGTAKAESYFKVDNIGDYENLELYRNIRLAIRANFLMKRDRDYVVKDNQVIIVDEFTGRLQIGRRFNDGLHTAIEAKEGIRIKDENQIVATITYQNLFRLYKKISGMTGTAKTEEEEFRNIYGLDIVVIPTNKPIARIDENDKLYTTASGKLKAVVEDIKDCYQRGQPVLVGTVSVEKSEELSSMLYRERIQHNVLNAKNHEKEAEIVAQAGRKGMVTIATNMAGRGTDIKLGGNAEFLAKQYLARLKYSESLIAEATSQFKDVSEKAIEVRDIYLAKKAEIQAEIDKEKDEVLSLGGLRIIGTERHESRRIDNQLRGRAGRQGDKGSSVFYISMEDDLLRIFGGDRMKSMVQALNLPEDYPISLKTITKRVEDAQKRLEARNYSIRKSVLSYDDVMNRQRTMIYVDRRKMLFDKTFYQESFEILHDSISSLLLGVEYGSLSFADDYHNINFDKLNKTIVHQLLQKEEWADYEFTKLLSESDFENFNVDKLAVNLADKAIRYYKNIANKYLDLLEKDCFEDAVDLAIDFNKSFEDWDYKKLNSIISNNLPSSIQFVAFTKEDASELNQQNTLQTEHIVQFIKDKLCKLLSEDLSKYDEQIINTYVNVALENAFANGKTTPEGYSDALNKDLEADHKIVLTSQDLVVSNQRAKTAVQSIIKDSIRKQNANYSQALLNDVIDSFAAKLSKNPYEWDAKKLDKELCSALFIKNQSGTLIVENIVNIKKINSNVLKYLVEIASTRIQNIYKEQYKNKTEDVINRIKGDFKTLQDYVSSLISSRVDMNEPATSWDFYRMCEVLTFNCLQKNDEKLANTLLNKDDLNGFDTAVLFDQFKSEVVSAYSEIISTMRIFQNEVLIQRALSVVPQTHSCTQVNDTLKNSLLLKELFGNDVVLIKEQDMSLDVTEKAKAVYENIENAISAKLNEFNSHILQSYIGLLAAQGLDKNAVIELLSTKLELKCAPQLKQINSDSLRLTQTVQTISQELVEKQKQFVLSKTDLLDSAVTALIGGEKIEGIEWDDDFAEKVSLNECKANAQNRLRQIYRSHRDEMSLNDSKLQEEICNLIESVVSQTLQMQKEEYIHWDLSKLNNRLAYGLLPANTPRELIMTYFTKRDISEIVREKLSDVLLERISPIFQEIIEKSKESGFKSAHDHILKMLPEVVAEVVADNIDFGIEINDWDYDEINANLRERIIPELDEDLPDFIDKQLAMSMNIDTVIDAVIEKVIAAYNKKLVYYNINLIQEYIDDEIKEYIDRRLPIENWNYKKLNNHFGRLFLAPVDRDKKIFTEEQLEKYLLSGKMTLGYPEVSKAVRDSLANIYVERIDVYNRFVGVFCRRRAKSVATFGDFERYNLLNYTDSHWFDHIDNMERLRVGIGLRALGQQNPITCYQSEGFQLFDEMIGLIHEDVVIHSLKDDPNSIFNRNEESLADKYGKKNNQKTVYYKKVGAKPVVRKSPKIGPNDMCPCGSGKKYKKCCMNKKAVVGGWNSIGSNDE